MDWKRDHVRALNQHKPCSRVRVAQLPMQYWPILWKFGVKKLTDLCTLTCMRTNSSKKHSCYASEVTMKL